MIPTAQKNPKKEEPKRPRGRPPKPKDDKPKRPRGRPPKPKEDKPKRPRGRPPKPKPQPLQLTKNRKLQKDANGHFVAAGTIQTDKEMDKYNLEVKNRSTLYAKDVDNAEKIGNIVGSGADAIAEAAKMVLTDENKIHLTNTKQVVEVAERYLRSCERVGKIPSKAGLAVAFGIGNKAAFDNFISRQPEHKTSIFLNILFEEFADINIQAGQSGSCHPIFAMYILKALYGVRENEPIQKAAESPLGSITDMDELMKKYEEIGDD